MRTLDHTGVGIPVYADHQYELVSVYENTSAEEQDSMAVMYLYLDDRHFHRPLVADHAGTSPQAARGATVR